MTLFLQVSRTVPRPLFAHGTVQYSTVLDLDWTLLELRAVFFNGLCQNRQNRH